MTHFGLRIPYRFLGWTAYGLLILGAALCIVQYAGWSGTYSGLYGLPSQMENLHEASSKAHFYIWDAFILSGISAVLAAFLIRRTEITLEDDSSVLDIAKHLVCLLLFVIFSIGVLLFVLIEAGHYIR